jgi:acyl carrier protein
MTKIQLEHELKELIIGSLDMENITPDEISSSDPIFNEGLGLDSIDALELGMAIKKRYGVSFGTDKVENQRHFSSISTLADFIASSAPIVLE